MVAALALSLLGASLSPAVAASAVPVPKGFRLMCIDHPGECRGGGASEVKLTSSLWLRLGKVNRDVNSRIKPVKNEVIDVWSINASRGDCEEYVLAKRRALIRQGVPASALSIVYALRNGGGHAILAVHTDQGDFVLDNMTQKIKRLGRTGYRIISMSGPNPLVWHRA